jgi:hypothetical protein
MIRRVALTVGFLTVTATAVGLEVWFATDHDPDTRPWTDLATSYIPGPIIMAGIAVLLAWLPGHFAEAIAKKRAKTMTETTTVVPATPEAGSASEPLVTPATVVASCSALVAMLVAFGLPLSDNQTVAILGFVTVAAPLLVAAWARRRVFAPATVRTMVVDAATHGDIRTEAAEVSTPAPPPAEPPEADTFTRRFSTP